MALNNIYDAIAATDAFWRRKKTEKGGGDKIDRNNKINRSVVGISDRAVKV